MATDVDEGYFNDLSRQPHMRNDSSISPQERIGTSEPYDNSDIPRTKRIACVICRKRKLKCDGNRPKCATCDRLGHNCAYDEVRRKSGPKRGYVKELEARLAQVETQLKGKAKKSKQDGSERQPSIPEANAMNEPVLDVGRSLAEPDMLQQTIVETPFNTMPNGNGSFTASNMMPEAMTGTSDFTPNMDFVLDDNFSWEMIGLGLEEPMPTQEAIDELHVTHAYFEKVHPSLPMLHKYRYYASMSLAPQARPPICLRYAMWSLAAAITDKYMHHQDIFYRRARKYIELDEMKGAGEAFVSLAHTQTWILIGAYEFKMMFFPRSWLSVGRAARMALMMGLNRIDGTGMDVKQCIPPARDWTELEERRRTFWMAYCVDRYASIGTGWPMSIDERDIMTTLPASEEAFEGERPQTTNHMNQTMSPEQMANLSAFAGVIHVTHFFGLNLTHLHRPEADEQEENLQALSLPSHLRLPLGVRNSNVAFLNFSLHTSIICLHQAAIFKIEKNKLPTSMSDNSRTRCFLAAGEIANIMRMTSHLDVAGMNPFMAFCLYVAARVFVQYLKKVPDGLEAKTSLEFLLTAMIALKRKNPLLESFMTQLSLDIEGNGIDALLHNPDFSSSLKDQLSPPLCAQLEGGQCRGIPYLKEATKATESQPKTAINHGFPDSHRSNTEGNSSSMSSDPPHQSHYAFNNIQMTAGDSRAAHPSFSENPVAEPSGLSGALPGKTRWGWSANEDTDLAPSGLNPFTNNNITTGSPFDTNMSDHTVSSWHGSSGLTPQSTNSNYQCSSHTSHSPPFVQEDDNAVTAPQQTPSMSPTTDPFKVPPGWESSGGTGMTPGFSGLTPGSDWEKMMQGLPWDHRT